MTLMEVVIGVALALVIFAGAVFVAFRMLNLSGPTRHGIRGNGDYDSGHHDSFGGSVLEVATVAETRPVWRVRCRSVPEQHWFSGRRAAIALAGESSDLEISPTFSPGYVIYGCCTDLATIHWEEFLNPSKPFS